MSFADTGGTPSVPNDATWHRDRRNASWVGPAVEGEVSNPWLNGGTELDFRSGAGIVPGREEEQQESSGRWGADHRQDENAREDPAESVPAQEEVYESEAKELWNREIVVALRDHALLRDGVADHGLEVARFLWNTLSQGFGPRYIWEKLVVMKAVSDPQRLVHMSFEGFGDGHEAQSLEECLGCQTSLEAEQDDDEQVLGTLTRRHKERMPSIVRRTIHQGLQGCGLALQVAGLFKKNYPELDWVERWSEEVGGLLKSLAARQLVLRAVIVRFNGTALAEDPAWSGNPYCRLCGQWGHWRRECRLSWIQAGALKSVAGDESWWKAFKKECN